MTRPLRHQSTEDFEDELPDPEPERLPIGTAAVVTGIACLFIGAVVMAAVTGGYV